MKGIDTNVLIRYILQDDKQQSALSTSFIEKECTVDNLGFINGIVLCEFVWVLETAYGYTREEIAPVLEKIVRTRQFHIHEPNIIWQAIRGYKNSAADFADQYICSVNLHNGCDCTMTFDKKASKLMGFELLKS